YEKGINCFPTHYTYLKTIINEALIQNLENKALKYSNQLFEIDPTNPRVPQDLIDIYFNQQKQDLLITFFENSIGNNNQNETLGNLFFHLALVYLNLENKNKADLHMKNAKEHF